MRPIKFGGKAVWNGNLLFEDLIHDADGVAYIGNLDACEAVEPDSIARLVGYTENGDEIYKSYQNKRFYLNRITA